MRKVRWSLILYGSKTKLTNAHKLVSQIKQPKYFVRAKMVTGDCSMALERCKPMDGETVLNTVEI